MKLSFFRSVKFMSIFFFLAHSMSASAIWKPFSCWANLIDSQGKSLSGTVSINGVKAPLKVGEAVAIDLFSFNIDIRLTLERLDENKLAPVHALSARKENGELLGQALHIYTHEGMHLRVPVAGDRFLNGYCHKWSNVPQEAVFLVPVDP